MALDNLQLPRSVQYGNSTLNIEKMLGGDAFNVVAASAYADVYIRVAVGERDTSQKMIVDAGKEVDERLELHFLSKGYGPVDIHHDVEGFETTTVNYGGDIPWRAGKHKRYLYGPGSILDAHSDHEHLSAEVMEEAVEGYKKLVWSALEK
ncbi:MAG: hypothetical protein Q9223_001276 [Gallowayella weberi]